METLVVMAHHRNQYYTKSKSQSHSRFGSSSPHFKGMNCRTFETRSGILPTPFKSSTSPLTKSPSSALASVDTPSKTTLLTKSISNFDDKTPTKTTPISSPVPISDKACKKERTFSDQDETFLLSELWAGPTYYNSPPPSSLPIPKFSVRPKRTVSLELPSSYHEVELPRVANSAPTSPRSDSSSCAGDFLVGADFATKNLCRILNLNLDDE